MGGAGALFNKKGHVSLWWDAKPVLVSSGSRQHRGGPRRLRTNLNLLPDIKLAKDSRGEAFRIWIPPDMGGTPMPRGADGSSTGPGHQQKSHRYPVAF